MHAMANSRVTGTDPAGAEHTVRVTGAGARRRLECGSCEWSRSAQFLPWLKAEEHLAEEHGAAVAADRQGGLGPGAEPGAVPEAGAAPEGGAAPGAGTEPEAGAASEGGA